MKKLFTCFITFILMTVPVFSKAHINAGASFAVLNFGENDRWGFGEDTRLTIDLGQKFGLTVSAGYLAWNKQNNNYLGKIGYKMNLRQKHLLLGMRYYFSKKKLQPYANVLYGYDFYRIESMDYRYDIKTLQVVSTTGRSSSDTCPDVGFGGGLRYPFNPKLNLDFNVSCHYPRDYDSQMRILAGLFYQF